MFDLYKGNNNIESWVYQFPNLMWGLGYDIAVEDPYIQADKIGLKIKPSSNERQNKKNILYILENSERQYVGNYLFNYWRWLTHWTYYYDEYEVDFVMRIIKILENKYNI